MYSSFKLSDGRKKLRVKTLNVRLESWNVTEFNLKLEPLEADTCGLIFLYDLYHDQTRRTALCSAVTVKVCLQALKHMIIHVFFPRIHPDKTWGTVTTTLPLGHNVQYRYLEELRIERRHLLQVGGHNCDTQDTLSHGELFE